MRVWLKPLEEILARGEAAMLVHLAELKGSAPREAGATMLVTESATFDTIGGGEMERTAILKARELLSAGGAAFVHLSLGPQLNQCCGGAVTIAFEPFAPADLAWLKKLIRAAEEPPQVTRTVTIEASGNFRRDWSTDADDGPDYDALIEAARVSIRERINPETQALWLFGAGHVGRAVAPVLAPLGFAMTWVDGRAGQFPDPALSGVRQLALAMPELAVDEAPPGTIFLVMTHSHPLDEAICEAILRRDDFAYLGLIGSATKRARFVKRLGEAGIPPAMLERLVCPIGIPSIGSKEPAAIAASVAADLLIRRERTVTQRGGRTVHGK
jgi:xanthine dehydrogenase accessory factor